MMHLMDVWIVVPVSPVYIFNIPKTSVSGSDGLHCGVGSLTPQKLSIVSKASSILSRTKLHLYYCTV
jgi:hypothetical protein